MHLSFAFARQEVSTKDLCDLTALYVLTVLPLDRFHLIFKPQLQLLEPDFFQFFVVGKVTLVGKRGKTLLVLRVLLGQLAEFIVRGQEVVSRGKHPADLLKSDCEVKLAHEIHVFNDEF